MLIRGASRYVKRVERRFWPAAESASGAVRPTVCLTTAQVVTSMLAFSALGRQRAGVVPASVAETALQGIIPKGIGAAGLAILAP